MLLSRTMHAAWNTCICIQTGQHLYGIAFSFREKTKLESAFFSLNVTTLPWFREHTGLSFQLTDRKANMTELKRQSYSLLRLFYHTPSRVPKIWINRCMHIWMSFNEKMLLYFCLCVESSWTWKQLHLFPQLHHVVKTGVFYPTHKLHLNQWKSSSVCSGPHLSSYPLSYQYHRMAARLQVLYPDLLKNSHVKCDWFL